jgi:hypothetical protein
MRLERNEGKLSRYVLRGGGYGNVASLPDKCTWLIFASFDPLQEGSHRGGELARCGKQCVSVARRSPSA